MSEIESDEAYRVRLINAYGWGAVCTVILETSGDELDRLAAHMNLPKREGRAESEVTQ